MSVAFPEVITKVQSRFEACSYVRSDPYTAMHNSAQVVLGKIDDNEFATLLASRPSALSRILREEGPANRKYTLREAAMKALLMEVVSALDITFIEPTVYKECEFSAPEFIRQKVYDYIRGPVGVTVTATEIGPECFFG